MESVELVKPSLVLAGAYLGWCSEQISADDRLAEILPTNREEVEGYIRACEIREVNGDSTTDFIPQTTFWLIRNGVEVIGESQLRHRLTPLYESVAGHIDYGIRLSERRKGYGTRLLALTLKKARDLGIMRVLVICKKDNVASIGVITKNGGVLHSEGINPTTGAVLLRYWFS